MLRLGFRIVSAIWFIFLWFVAMLVAVLGFVVFSIGVLFVAVGTRMLKLALKLSGADSGEDVTRDEIQR